MMSRVACETEAKVAVYNQASASSLVVPPR